MAPLAATSSTCAGTCALSSTTWSTGYRLSSCSFDSPSLKTRRHVATIGTAYAAICAAAFSRVSVYSSTSTSRKRSAASRSSFFSGVRISAVSPSSDATIASGSPCNPNSCDVMPERSSSVASLTRFSMLSSVSDGGGAASPRAALERLSSQTVTLASI